MNRLFSIGMIAFMCLGFQSQSLASDDNQECKCTTLRVFVPVSGAKQPWQLCVRNNNSTECSWLEAGGTNAIFTSSIDVNSLEHEGTLTIFVQNHPEGQACIVDHPGGGNTSVKCYDIVQ